MYGLFVAEPEKIGLVCAGARGKESRQHYTLMMSPRRARAAGRLLEFLTERGGKLFLDAPTYQRLLRATGLDRCSVDRAADDLCECGLIGLKVIGEMSVLIAGEGRA
jgi:hypothetical protein